MLYYYISWIWFSFYQSEFQALLDTQPQPYINQPDRNYRASHRVAPT